MKKSISVNKKSRGRPKKKGGVDPVTAVRLPPRLSEAVDAWAITQEDEPGRSEAIRRLVELGLKMTGLQKFIEQGAYGEKSGRVAYVSRLDSLPEAGEGMTWQKAESFIAADDLLRDAGLKDSGRN